MTDQVTDRREENPMGGAADPYETIGKGEIRYDAVGKVTGEAVYCTDFSRADQLYGKILYSDRPHARIVNIDVGPALAMEGVKAVVTSADTPELRYGLYMRDRYVFAKNRVRHIGEPVAAVAAESELLAEKARAAIVVEYEDLPAVFSAEEALAADAPILHPEVQDYAGLYDWSSYDNVCMDAEVGQGDVEKGFAESDHVFEDTYRLAAMHQAYLEPHACLAELDHTGRVTVWTGRQQLSVCHKEMADALDVPMTDIRVVPLWLGGGFGGKLKSHLEPIAALLAREARRPVRLRLTREEDFVSTHPRAPFVVKLKTGVTDDGRLLARDADILVDAGAYSDHTIGISIHAASYSTGPYHIPNCHARVRDVYTNNPDWGCMRGYGALQAQFASESQMDAIAAGLGMDPVELRRKNLCKDGDKKITGQVLHGVQISETMDAALEASDYWNKKEKLGPNRGIGVANSILNTGLMFSSAFVRVNEDATVTLITSITDHGTGNHTALCQIAAETLRVPVEKVRVANQDSDSSPPDTGSIASRTIYDTGNAVRKAAEDVRDHLISTAADAFGCDRDEVVYEGDRIFVRGNPEAALSFADVAAISFYAGEGPPLGRGSWLAKGPYEQLPGRGFGEHPAAIYMFGTHVVEVEVDPDTGRTEVLDYTACHDVGQIINQQGIEGQVEGGVVQGIGYGLYERLALQDGRIQNPSFVDYQIPTALDAPPIKTLFVEEPDPTGPFGAKGIGEPPFIPPMPAIANAIYDALGVRVKDVPITPEKLWRAVHKQES
jgi:CO/xanthine dehydrogenase Mo-binding subunit